jgi:undecaprenyl diphosphate synthase
VKPSPAPIEGAAFPGDADGRAPRHVAIIMDGNGRWAAKRGLPRVAGHRAGAEALIGDPAAFGPQLVERLERAVERTAANDRLTLVVALNYGARGEIAAAAQKLAAKAVANELSPGEIDETAVGAELMTSDLPELDLLIRTSGEKRLSNFLLWRAAYAELIFIDTLWPDFDETAFRDALEEYAGRQRRFGGR